MRCTFKAESFAYPRVVIMRGRGEERGAGETEGCPHGMAMAGMTVLAHSLTSDVPRAGIFNERAQRGNSKKDHESDRDGDECPELHWWGLGGGVADGRGDGVGCAQEVVRDAGDRTGCAATDVGKIHRGNDRTIGTRFRDGLRVGGVECGSGSCAELRADCCEDGEGGDDGDEPCDAFASDSLGDFFAQTELPLVGLVLYSGLFFLGLRSLPPGRSGIVFCRFSSLMIEMCSRILF